MANSKDRSQTTSTSHSVVTHEQTSTTRGGPTVADVHAVAREKEEPYSQRTGFPIFVLALCALIGVVAVVYGVSLAGGPALSDFSKNRLPFLPELSPEAKAAKLALKAPNLYKANCSSCHQENGMGQGDYPPLVASDYVTGSVQRLIAIVHSGVKGPIEVAGTLYPGNQQMPANGGLPALSDDDLALVLTYVRTTWGNTASGVSPEQVAFARTALADRTEAWTEAQLKAFEDAPDFPKPPESATSSPDATEAATPDGDDA